MGGASKTKPVAGAVITLRLILRAVIKRLLLRDVRGNVGRIILLQPIGGHNSRPIGTTTERTHRGQSSPTKCARSTGGRSSANKGRHTLARRTFFDWHKDLLTRENDPTAMFRFVATSMVAFAAFDSYYGDGRYLQATQALVVALYHHFLVEP
jgi:hypothetical protein